MSNHFIRKLTNKVILIAVEGCAKLCLVVVLIEEAGLLVRAVAQGMEKRVYRKKHF